MDPFTDSCLVTPIDLSVLSSEERTQARQIADATNALLLKGLFHRIHPERYRISDRMDSHEYRIAAAIGAIPSHRFVTMRPIIEAIRTDTVKTAAYLGGFANLDIRSSGLDALIRQVAPHLVRNEAPSSLSQGMADVDKCPNLILCLAARIEPDVDDQEAAGALTQVLTAIANAAAGFNGDGVTIFAGLTPVVGLVLSLFFDDGAQHELAPVQAYGWTG